MTEFDPESLPTKNLVDLAADPPEGLREWMQQMVNDGKGGNRGELEQWYDRMFPESENRARALVDDDATWELITAPWHAKATAGAQYVLKWGDDSPENIQRWVKRVLSKARAATRREVGRFGNLQSGYVAGFAGDKFQEYAYKIERYAEAEARNAARRKAQAPAKAKQREEDDAHAKELGIEDNSVIRAIPAATLKRVSATSSPYTDYGTDYPQFATMLGQHDGDTYECITTGEVKKGDALWRLMKDGNKWIRYPSVAKTVEPLGVRNGEVFYRVVTAKANADDTAMLHEEYEGYEIDRRG